MPAEKPFSTRPKTNSRKISEPRSNKSLFVPTLLSIALLSAFSSSAIAANSGGYELQTGNPNFVEKYYGNNVKLTNNNVIFNESIEGISAVYGAYTEDNDKDVSGNKLTVSSSTTPLDADFPFSFYGGSADVDSIDENVTTQTNQNTVSISNITKPSGSIVIGGESYAYTANGNALADANNNTVIFSLSHIQQAVGGWAYASSDSADATSRANENEVNIIDNSSVKYGMLRGGYSIATADNGEALAEADYNTVTISQSSVGDDGFAEVYGGYAIADTARANNNTVTISNSTVTGRVFGGRADAVIAHADNNTVTIDSSEFTGEYLIVGGAVLGSGDSETLTATYNTVNISGINDIASVSLLGGYDALDSSVTNYDLFTGNTLNLDGRQNATTSVNKVGNFETINIKAGNVTNGAVILDATGGAELGDGNKGTTVNLLSVDTGNLDAKDRIILISSATGDLANEGQKQFVPIGNSIALGYIGQTNLESNDVIFNIEGKGTNPKTKVLNESRAAEMAFLNSAADLLQDQDIHKAGKHVFGAVRGIYNKYKTGSSVDISGVGLVTGVANTWAGDSADLTGAVFVEAGWGSFDTKNDIMGSVQRGDGDSHYYGTGLITKFDVTQGLFSGLYAEAAAHVGIISTDYSNAGLSTLNGVTASYDTDSLYYAAHATAGYRWNMTDKFDLDLSATYLWNYLESQEVKIAQDRFEFDSVQSHRMRLAAELGYTGDKGFRPYAGVAWEREFDGEAGGSVEGVRLEEADLGGDSGLAWAGVSFEPKEGGPVKADALITTYFGQRKGVSGRIWVRYEF